MKIYELSIQWTCGPNSFTLRNVPHTGGDDFTLTIESESGPELATLVHREVLSIADNLRRLSYVMQDADGDENGT